MDITGSEVGTIDWAKFGSKWIQGFYKTAEKNATNVFSAADRTFNDKDGPTTDEILMALSPAVQVDLYRETRRAAPISRARIVALDPNSSGSWGGSATISSIAMQTLLRNHIIECKISTVMTMPVRLPNMGSHLNMPNTGKLIIKIREEGGKADTAGLTATDKIEYVVAIKVQFLKGMRPPATGESHRDAVRMPEYPSFRVAQEVKVVFNNSHSGVLFKRDTMLTFFAHWSNNQLRIFDEVFCKNKKAIVHERVSNGIDPFAEMVAVSDHLIEKYGNTATAQLSKVKSKGFIDDFAKKAYTPYFNSVMPAKHIYEVDVGNNCPKIAHENPSLLLTWPSYIARGANRSHASNTFGMSTCDVSIKWATKEEMFIVDSTDLVVSISWMLLQVDSSAGKVMTCPYMHTIRIPVIMADTKIVGGNIVSATEYNEYLEFDNTLNTMLLNSVTIDKEEIPREGTVELPASSSNSLTTSLSIHGLITSGIISALSVMLTSGIQLFQQRLSKKSAKAER